LNTPLILVGCGGHARSLIDVIESLQEWSIIGLIGRQSEVGHTILGYQCIGTDRDLVELKSHCQHACIGVGQIGRCTSRGDLIQRLTALEFSFPSLISRYAYVSQHASLGMGVTVGHGAVINAGAKIGNHSIVNSCALVEHDAMIGERCHISTGALINGGVKIGDDSFVGSGVMIRDHLQLPSHTVISAGKRVMGWPLR